MTTKIEPTTSEIIEDLIDFSEVEWSPADPKRVKIDYGSLESTKALLRGEPIEVPLNTSTHRLYRFLRKHNLTLRRRKMKEVMVLWTEPRTK